LLNGIFFHFTSYTAFASFELGFERRRASCIWCTILFVPSSTSQRKFKKIYFKKMSCSFLEQCEQTLLLFNYVHVRPETIKWTFVANTQHYPSNGKSAKSVLQMCFSVVFVWFLDAIIELIAQFKLPIYFSTQKIF